MHFVRLRTRYSRGTSSLDDWQVPSQKGAATGHSGGEESGTNGTPRFGERHESSAARSPHVSPEVPAMVGSTFDGARFYRDLLYELELHSCRGGTSYGFGTVMKRVALSYGLRVEGVPLPRPSRAEREDLAWARSVKAVRADVAVEEAQNRAGRSSGALRSLDQQLHRWVLSMARVTLRRPTCHGIRL